MHVMHTIAVAAIIGKVLVKNYYNSMGELKSWALFKKKKAMGLMASG